MRKKSRKVFVNGKTQWRWLDCMSLKAMLVERSKYLMPQVGQKAAVTAERNEF